MITIHENASLKDYNTFGIDCRCQSLIEFNDTFDLRRLYEKGVFNNRWMMLGAGANTLFDCDYYGGTILRSTSHLYQAQTTGRHCHIKAGSGWVWDKLVDHMMGNGIAGAENLSGIPASLGGAIVQNIGAYGQEISELVSDVEIFDTLTGEIRLLSKDNCGFGYRTSRFKHDGCPVIVTNATLHMVCEDKGWNPCLAYAPLQAYYKSGMTAKDIRKWVLNTRNSKLPDPKILGNAGSFFVNPVVSPEKARGLITSNPGMPQYETDGGIKLAAGWLIEHAGLKGYRHGNVGVDKNNALVLVNHGGATGSEVLQLARHIINEVRRQYGVELRPEVRIIK